MRLACSTLIFGKTRDKKSFEKALSSISESGYKGLQIEYGLLPSDLRAQPGRVHNMVEQVGLETIAVAVDTNPRELLFTAVVDGKIGTLCLFQRSLEQAKYQVRKLLKHCERLDLQLAVHPHVKSSVEAIQEVEEILEISKRRHLALVFDSAHFTALGWDLANFIERFCSRISVVHIKDLRQLKSPDLIDYNKDFVDIGDGIIDFEGLVSALKKTRYEGWLVVEVDHSQSGNPSDSIKKNYERLSNLL